MLSAAAPVLSTAGLLGDLNPKNVDTITKPGSVYTKAPAPGTQGQAKGLLTRNCWLKESVEHTFGHVGLLFSVHKTFWGCLVKHESAIQEDLKSAHLQ